MCLPVGQDVGGLEDHGQIVVAESGAEDLAQAATVRVGRGADGQYGGRADPPGPGR